MRLENGGKTPLNWENGGKSSQFGKIIASNNWISENCEKHHRIYKNSTKPLE